MEAIAAPPSSTAGCTHVHSFGTIIGKLVAVAEHFECERQTMSDSLEILGSQNKFLSRCTGAKARAWLSSNYRDSVRILSEQFHDANVSREALIRDPGPRTQRVFELCTDVLQATGVEVSEAREFTKAARRVMFNTPFDPFPEFSADRLGVAASGNRQTQLKTHVRYLAAGYDGNLELKKSQALISSYLRVAGASPDPAEFPQALSFTRALIAQMLEQAGRNDAAMLTPQELTERRRQYFSRNGFLENRRADAAAAELLAKEEEKLTLPIPLPRAVVTSKPQVQVPEPAAKFETDKQLKRFWNRYGKMAASTDTSAKDWLEFISQLDNRDERLSYMKKQIRNDLGAALSREHRFDVTQTEAETEATLFVQWFTAFATPAEKSSVYSYYTDALHAATNRGLELPFGNARAKLFESDTLQKDATPVHGLQAIKPTAPIAECCRIAMLPDLSAVVLTGENMYGSGFVMSLRVFAKILHGASIGQGPSSNTIVGSTAYLLHHLRDIEEKGLKVG